MKYGCKPCNYQSDNKTNFLKHKQSEKHMQNDKIFEKSELDNVISEILQYMCEYCDKPHTTVASLVCHEKTCSNKKLITQKYETIITKLKKECEVKINTISAKCDSLETQIKLLEKNIVSRDDMIEMLTMYKDDMKSVSVSALQYITHNYAPPAIKVLKLEEYPKLEYMIELLDNNETNFVREIIFQADNENLHKYLGAIIVKLYKNDDPNQQSMWNSDVSRLSYLMREKIGDKDAWTADKSGVKILEFVIKPFLQYILSLIKNHVNNIKPKDGASFKQIDDANDETHKCIKIQQRIEDNKPDLSSPINKYIAPYFFLSQKNNLEQITEK